MFPASFSGEFRIDAAARAAYSEGAGIFRILPRGVAVPSTTAALQELTRWANDNRVPLIPRGAGSGMAGGNVGDGIIVDLTALDGCPLQVDPRARIVRAGAGVTLRDLQTDAARFGLRLPPDPSSGRFATLGGMASTNAAGPATVRHGSLRGWVEALELVTVEGEIVALRRGTPRPPAAAIDRFTRDAEPSLRAAADRIANRFPTTRKNSSGYALDRFLASGDLIDLLVGSEGTLGIITGLECRLDPIPRFRSGVRAGIRDLGKTAAKIPDLLALGPAVFEFLDRTLLRFLEEAGIAIDAAWDGLLLLEFEGENREAVLATTSRAVEVLGDNAEDIRRAEGPRALEELWEIRHSASPLLATLGDTLRSLQVIEDACVPVDRVPDYVAAVRAAGERHQVRLVIFGHLGDGNVHVNLQPDVSRDGWEAGVERIFEEVTSAVIRLGGTLSGEHGDGRLRAPVLEHLYGAEMVELFRGVKRAFDPQGILNPGVKLPLPGQQALGALKVGASAVPISSEIEQKLRIIERTGGYSVSRLEIT